MVQSEKSVYLAEYPFLEVFGASSFKGNNEQSLPFIIITSFLENFGLEVNLILLGTFLVLSGLLREFFSLVNQLSTQNLIGKIEENGQVRAAKTFMASHFVVAQNIGSGNFYEMVSNCTRETGRLLQSKLQIFGSVITITFYLLVIIVSSPILAIGAVLAAILGILFLNYTSKRAQKLGREIVSEREKLAQLSFSTYQQMRDIKSILLNMFLEKCSLPPHGTFIISLFA